MINVRRADERGKADFGWLKSRHTFSFGEYYDPRHMGVSALRVINDDRVAPGGGFPTHGHSDMEIISYVLEGEIAHRDSEGNVATLPPGEFQLMSAGSGIRHSEFNPSQKDSLHFLQIWIHPNVYGVAPGYQQKHFGAQPGLTLVASPDGADGSLTIRQDARLYQLLLQPEAEAILPTRTGRNYYVHLVDGVLAVNGEELQPGDGAHVHEVAALHLQAQGNSVRALVFDLP
jgi:redox-sensitive bicupin YhaK (pirin superfamily)